MAANYNRIKIINIPCQLNWIPCQLNRIYTNNLGGQSISTRRATDLLLQCYSIFPTSTDKNNNMQNLKENRLNL